jgi:hypothetical protein
MGYDVLKAQPAAWNDRQVSDLIHDQEQGPAQEANARSIAFPFGVGESTDDVGKACEVVCTKNSDSDVVLMQSTEESMLHDIAGPLDRARDRCIFVQRSVHLMSACCVCGRC